MKAMLNTKVSIKSFLIIVLIATMLIIATGAVSQRIQATLSPDIAITLNGVVQNLRDGNGNPVYPIIYNGVTYLPVRAVSDITGMDVRWDSANRTVRLTNRVVGNAVRLTEVGTANYGVTVTNDMRQFPGYNFGFQLTGFNFAHTVRSEMPLQGRYTTLTFDVAMVSLVEDPNRFDPLRLRLLNAETAALIWEGLCEPGQILKDVEVSILGVRTLRWVFSGGAMANQAVGYILDPIVK